MPSRSKDELWSALHYSYLSQEHLAVCSYTAALSPHRRRQEPKLCANRRASLRGANSSAGQAVAYQQTGGSRGAGARAAGQTDTGWFLSYSTLEQYRRLGREQSSRSAGNAKKSTGKEESPGPSNRLDSTPTVTKLLPQTESTGAREKQPIAMRQSGPQYLSIDCLMVPCDVPPTSVPPDLLSNRDVGRNPSFDPLFPHGSLPTEASQTAVCMVQSHLEFFKCLLPLCSGNV
jgi:hypothetical protein